MKQALAAAVHLVDTDLIKTHAPPMKHLLTALALALAALPLRAADKAGPVTATFHINEVKCSTCANSIDESLRKLATVTKVDDLSESSGFAVVTFDAKVVSHHQVAQAIFAANPVHGEPYVATLKFSVPEYAKGDNAAKVDALFAKHKSQVRVELKNKARGDFLLHFEPLAVDGGKKGPQGWTLDTFRAGLQALGLTFELK